MQTRRHTFYVEDFPNLAEDTPLTIVIPRNAGRRFPVEIELPVEVGQAYTPPTPAYFSPPPPSTFQASSPRLTPFSIGMDREEFISASMPARQAQADTAFSPRQFTPQRQPTLMEAMQQTPLSPRLSPPRSPVQSPSPQFSPIARVSPGYFGDSLSPNLTGNTTLSPTAVQSPPRQASPCLSPYVGGQTNRPSLEQMDTMRQYGSYY